MIPMTMVESEQDRRTALTQAVVRVGDGRGFVVEHRNQLGHVGRLVLTAAHCLPTLPPAHPFAFTEEQTYRALLGPLGREPTVWAECLFADPVADIAALGQPDNQALSDQAHAYDALVWDVTPFRVADAPRQGSELLKSPYGDKFCRTIKVPTPGRGPALVLSLAGKWVECTVTRPSSEWLTVDQGELVEGGMSGSPILSPIGQAISLMSTGELNPVLVENLPRRLKVKR
jgi:hypothetical protein